MKMHEIEVYENQDGNLVLIQGDVLGEESLIVLSFEQVPMVCDWMMRVAGQNTETHEVKRLED